MIRRLPTLVALLFLLMPCLVPAGARGEEHAAKYYFGYATQLTPREIDTLRADLKAASDPRTCTTIDTPCPPAEAALELLFGGTFRPNLPDVLVYVERRDDGTLVPHEPLLLWQGKLTPYIYGARHVYALIVSDVRLSLDARLTTIVETTSNPLAGLLTLLNFKAADPAPKEPKSDTAHVSWQHLGPRFDDPYLGWARLEVQLGSINRLTLSERGESVERTVTEGACEGCPMTKIEAKSSGPEPLPGDAPHPPFQAVTTHISNSRAGHAGFGIALGATFDTKDTAAGEASGSLHVNGYALAKVYLLRPRLKVGPRKHTQYRYSIALVAGTNVGDGTFDELIGGISVGHLIGKLGLTVAVNGVKPKEAMDGAESGGDGRGRRARLFVGLDYTF